MILITGGAGFIGSCLHAALSTRGESPVIADWLGDAGKWRNLARHPPAQIIRPEALDAWLADGPRLRAIVHLGAISETTATDGDLAWDTNVALPLRLWGWCAAHGVPFIYASSASTYGNGAQGFDDDIDALDALRPLNLYGWTKHAFDLRVRAMLRAGEPAPPQWAGLKFFNVYGPNEDHKGRMISVVRVKQRELAAGGEATLFRADREGMADGDQRRDFVWVGDIVDVILWLLETPGVSGLFNLGTGRARSYLDLARATCAAMGLPERIRFVDMPEALRGQYQSYTEARMDRLRAAGYAGQFTPLEDGVRRYVQDFLARGESFS